MTDEPAYDKATTAKATAIADVIMKVLVPIGMLIGTWVERSLAIQERVAVALEAKAADVDHDAVFELLKEAYEDRYDGSGRNTNSIVRAKYAKRLMVALGKKS